jgi:DNA-binding transcriptional regulator/RsmH inhibitor MraZ
VNSCFEQERFLRWQLEESSNTPEAVVNSSAGGAQPKKHKVLVGKKRFAIDSGGRIRLPADYFEALGGNPVMRYVGPGILVLMSYLDYQNDLEQYDNRYPKETLNSGFKYSLEYIHDIVADHGSYFECPVDGNGRILIPKERRISAHLEGDVVFITATGSKFYLLSEKADRQMEANKRRKERENKARKEIEESENR